MARILVVAKGSFGDLFPMAAIAESLIARGHQVCFACPTQLAYTIAGLGVQILALDARLPDRRSWLHALGLDGLLNKLLELETGRLRDEIALLSPVAEQVDCIVANQIAFAAPLVAEALGKPWAYCAISPLAVYSQHDPPRFPVLHALLPGGGRWRWRWPLERVIARAVSYIWGWEIVRERRRLALASRGHPLFEGKFSPYLNLYLCSPALIERQVDWPAHTVLTGYCWFEPTALGTPAAREQLDAFLDAGAAPAVVVLGSDSRDNPGRFYRTAIAACRQVGLRVVVLADSRFHTDLPAGDDILASAYVPYAWLFGRARVVIHSAGIGAIGWCLRYGTFSILSPGAEDQFENAARAVRKGYARSVARRRFSITNLAAALGEFLADEDWARRGARVAAQVGVEDGAVIACGEIEQRLL